MRLPGASSGFPLSAVAIAILLASIPGAPAAEVVAHKPASLHARTKSFVLTSGTLSLAKVAVAQRKVPGIFGTELFRTVTEKSGFALSGLDMRLVPLRGKRSTFANIFALLSGGNARAGISLGLELSSTAKPVLGSGPKRTGTDGGTLAVDPPTIDFGAVPVGSYENKMGTLMASDSDVTVSSATIDNPEFTLSGLSFPFTIPAGNRRNYTVTFAPQNYQTTSSTLTFVTDGEAFTSQGLTGIGVSQSGHLVELSWNASTTQDVIGYNVYRGTTSGGPYGKINSVLDPSTVYTDAAVTDGTTYYYVATAVDSNGQESVYSNEVQAVIP
jgi:hypothetical protein